MELYRFPRLFYLSSCKPQPIDAKCRSRDTINNGVGAENMFYFILTPSLSLVFWTWLSWVGGKRKQDAFKTRNLFLNGAEGRISVLRMCQKRSVPCLCEAFSGKSRSSSFSNMTLSLWAPERGCHFNFTLVIFFSVARSSILGRLQITFEKFGALFLSVTPLHTSHGLVPTSAIL